MAAGSSSALLLISEAGGKKVTSAKMRSQIRPKASYTHWSVEAASLSHPLPLPQVQRVKKLRVQMPAKGPKLYGTDLPGASTTTGAPRSIRGQFTWASRFWVKPKS